MTGPAPSERDLAVLRSFARRIDPSDAGAHNNLGVLYYQKGLVPEAIAGFTRALELDPKMEVAQANMAIAYQNTGYYDTRVAELREALRRQPDDRTARWELGRVFAALGNHTDAIAEFETLLSRHPGDVPALIQLGMAEKARGGMDQASEWFRRAAERDPESSIAQFYYGESLYNRGLNDAALEGLARAVRLNPDNADAHYLLAFVHGDMGQHEQARAATKRALALNPTLGRAQANLSVEDRRSQAIRRRSTLEAMRPQVAEGEMLAHFNLGLAFRQKGYYVEALREYRLALDSGEDRRLTLQAMAEVHLIRRDIAAALELYDGLVQEFPDSPKLWNERAVCLHQANRRDEAAAGYARATANDPHYGLAWNNLGVLRSQLNDIEGAQEAFQTALRGKRDLAAARLNLALLLFQQRRFQMALEAYRQVLADHPQNAVAWNGIGLVLVELKRYPDAKNAFARAVEADDKLASAHYNLSFTLSHLGDFDGALRETKRALELEPYYVPQKYALAIDLQYEDPNLSITPEISADVHAEEVGEEFNFDQRLLDQLFTELEPTAPGTEAARTSGSGSALSAALPGDDLLAMARDQLSKGFIDRAAGEVDRAIQRGADPVRAAVLQGEVFTRRGFHGEALERFREARLVRTDDPEARLGELRALLALDRGAEAAPLAEELIAMRPTDVDALVAGARARMAGGNALGALEYVRTAQARAPGRPDLFQLQAAVCSRLGDTGGAMAAYQAALELDAAIPQVWYELGHLQEQEGRHAEARGSYERALDILPTFSQATLALGDLYRRTGQSATALELLIPLLEQDPYDFDALVLLGRALLDQARADKAAEAFSRVLRFEPDRVEAWYHLGAARNGDRRYAEAVEAWDRVVQLAPTTDYATAARKNARSAKDLAHIFAGREG